MPTDAQPGTHTTRHSALEEFRRDERRPAVVLLVVLLVAAAFFALGIMVGRWTAGAGAPRRGHDAGAQESPTAATPANQPAPFSRNDGARGTQSASGIVGKHGRS